jgi:hypothetical protein
MTLLVILLPGPAGNAGDQPALPPLAKQAAGALVVRVQLGSDKLPADVTLVRVIAGPSADVDPGAGWLDACLPSRALLSRWLRQHPKSPARPLWEQALERGSYEATVFTRSRKGRSTRLCGSEAAEMKHTDLHPDYAGYVKAVEAELGRRAAQNAP